MHELCRQAVRQGLVAGLFRAEELFIASLRWLEVVPHLHGIGVGSPWLPERTLARRVALQSEVHLVRWLSYCAKPINLVMPYRHELAADSSAFAELSQNVDYFLDGLDLLISQRRRLRAFGVLQGNSRSYADNRRDVREARVCRRQLKLLLAPCQGKGLAAQAEKLLPALGPT